MPPGLLRSTPPRAFSHAVGSTNTLTGRREAEGQRMTWLFDTSHFQTRSHCGLGWTDALRYTYMLSNIVIAMAYFGIPVALLVLYRSKRQELPSPWLLLNFAAFIWLCGLSHVTDVTVFYWAPYRLYTLIFALTAIASFGTAIALPTVVKKLVKLPSREYVHSLNNQLNALVLERELQLCERTAERDKLLAELEAAKNAVLSQSRLLERGAARKEVLSQSGEHWIAGTTAVLERLNAATRILMER
jgi:hypothetical protein